MEVKEQAKLNVEHGLTRLSTSGDIVYKAYSRPYMNGPGQVINLFASCSYGEGNWKIFFQGDGKGNYELMEQVPGIVYFIVTYYTACFTPGIGTEGPVEYVTIRDASGEHKVPVEPMK